MGGGAIAPLPSPGYATGLIIAVYIHFIIDDFIPHVLPTVCLHGINAIVALRVVWVTCGFEVSLLSRVTPNSLVSSKVQVLNHSLTRNPNLDYVCE